MKKTGWIATVAAGVVLVGGGAWAATAIASDEPAAEPEIVTTPGGEPNSVPVETASPTPTVTPTPEATYSEGQAELIRITQTGLLSDLELSDAEIIDAAATVCEAPAGSDYSSLTLRGADDADLRQFWVDAEYHAC